MIIDSLVNLKKYKKLIPDIEVITQYLNNTDLSQISQGEHKISPTIRCLVSEYIADKESTSLQELHKKEIDLQIIIKGKERFSSSISVGKIIKPFDGIHDVAFQASIDQIVFEADNTMFVIFFPYEPHYCSLLTKEGKSNVKKCVFKILYTQ